MKRSMRNGLGVLAAIAVLGVAGVAQGEAQERQRVQVAPENRVFGVLNGTGSYLGASILEVDDERAAEAGLGEEFGVYVSTVSEEGPAADAGLETGDVITSWNGERVEGVVELQRLLRETPPGRTVSLGVVRDGDERTVEVELADRSPRTFTVPGTGRLELRRSGDAPRLVRPEGRTGRSFMLARRARLGIGIQSLGEQLADYFGVEGGALVTSVQEDSPAGRAGLRAGDVIVRFGDDDVEDPGDLLEALRAVEPGTVEVGIVRDGSARTLTVEFSEDDTSAFGGVLGDGVNFRLWSGEGEDFSVEPFRMEGVEWGPMELDGFEIEPFQWHWEGVDGDGIQVRIPRIEVPGFEVPAIRLPEIEVPGFRMTAPRVEVRV